MALKQDEELDQLEENIRRLKSSYDQFFMAIRKVPPMQERRNLENLIFELGKQKMRDNGRRFRFNSLLSRFNQYREMWGRKMREREEGPMEFNRRKAALSAANEPPPPPPRESPRVTSDTSDPYVRVAQGTNGEGVRKLYAEIEREHQKLGKASNVTFEQLEAMVQKQADSIRSRHNVSEVAFRVETVDGKVKLKAKPVQE